MALSKQTARIIKLPPVAIFAVGSEVVQGYIVNSNAAWLAREMAELGFEVVRHEAVRDDKDAIAARIRPCMPQGLLVIVTGGIGPTVDDMTRQAVSDALSRKLVLDKEDLARLHARYAAMGREFPRGSEIQCMRPEGARLVPNAHGTASCFLVKHGNGGVAVLPGVPREMKAVFADELRAALVADFGSPGKFYTRELKCFGMPESAIDIACRDLLTHANASAAILVDDAVIRLRWRVLAIDEAAAAVVLDPIADEARKRLGDVVFGTYEDSLEGVTVAACKHAGLTVALAESCTGGMIAHLLTSVPGSSDVLIESAVTYHNEAKIRRLGVKQATLDTHGAVSEPCVREMVEGIARESKADLCVATSGVAGPGGGTEDKPVGTVWLAAWFKGETRAWKLNVPGDRELVKWRSARTAINVLRITAQKGALPDKPAHWIVPP